MGQWGDAGKGALGGAATGATIGAAAGPYGALIGGAVGGIAGGIGGYFSGDSAATDARNNLNVSLPNYGAATGALGQIAANAQNRPAPQAYTPQLGPAYQLDRTQIDQSRGGMLGVANNLGAIASGQQAGAGELAVNRQVGQATAAQASAARMARGANAALAYRNAARNTADIGLAGAGQAAQAQMADQQGANAQLGQIYGSMYGQDANVAAQNAQLSQQAMIQQAQMGQTTALANLQAQLAQSGMNDQQQMAALGQMLGWDQATVNARLAKAGLPITPSVLNNALGQAGTIAAMYSTRGIGSSAPSGQQPAAPPLSQQFPTGGGGGGGPVTSPDQVG